MDRMYAAISIDAEVPVSFEAPGDVDDIIKVSERHCVPITWLIYTSVTRPEEVVRYYHDRAPGRRPLPRRTSWSVLSPIFENAATSSRL